MTGIHTESLGEEEYQVYQESFGDFVMEAEAAQQPRRTKVRLGVPPYLRTAFSIMI
jgi:hypothetical protein